MNVVLQTRAVSRRYGGVVAVDSVDFTLAKGELRCLIGPNGAGKSTFFKMLCGIVRPSAGVIELNQRDVTGMRPQQIAARGVGIKTQVPNLFDGFTVRESVEVAALRKFTAAPARESAEAALARVHMDHLGDRVVGHLAHGQRQWVELAMVLATEPEIVLLDEPIAGMTKEEASRTEALLHEVNERATLVVVEHDMQFVKRIATKVTVFHQGKILMEDQAEAVLSDARVRDVYLGRSESHHA